MKIMAVNFLAALSQTVAGFGAPLISMPFMINWLGLGIATPLSTLIGLLTSIIVLIYYRSQFSFNEVGDLIIPAILGVPVGVFFLTGIDIKLAETLLAVVIIAYAVYSVFAPSLPALREHYWGYAFGFAAGVMGGAFNISGPIVVIYAAFRQWSPEKFRSNLQGFFLVTNIVIMLSYWGAGALDGAYWTAFGWALPGMLMGIIFGIYLSKRINVVRFRQLVIVLLFVSGIYLLV